MKTMNNEESWVWFRGSVSISTSSVSLYFAIWAGLAQIKCNMSEFGLYLRSNPVKDS